MPRNPDSNGTVLLHVAKFSGMTTDFWLLVGASGPRLCPQRLSRGRQSSERNRGQQADTDIFQASLHQSLTWASQEPYDKYPKPQCSGKNTVAGEVTWLALADTAQLLWTLAGILGQPQTICPRACLLWGTTALQRGTCNWEMSSRSPAPRLAQLGHGGCPSSDVDT